MPAPRRRPRWLAPLAAALLLACGCAREPAGRGAVGELAPRITGKGLDGDYIALDDHRGEVVLINLWATWCAPCRAELPALERLHQRFGARGFAVLGVSVDSERSEPDVRGMVRTFRLSYPIVLDPAARAAAIYEATGYPTSILVGRDGRVRWRRAGALSDKEEGLIEAIEAAVAEPPPAD
ncbi:MAG: TlpA disulfide reductase family protein [Nannocystaceae bacterium]